MVGGVAHHTNTLPRIIIVVEPRTVARNAIHHNGLGRVVGASIVSRRTVAAGPGTRQGGLTRRVGTKKRYELRTAA